MPADTQLPEAADCIERYLDAWELFGAAEFTTGEFHRVSLEAGHDRIPTDEDLQRHLETLVAYGLLDWHGEDRYRVRVAPDATADSWVEQLAPRIERLHAQVQSIREDRTAGESRGSEEEHVRYRGEQYLSVTVTDAPTFERQTATLSESLESRSHANVVLRSPADEAARAQRFADELCDGDAMAELGRLGPFEKVTSEVVGSDPDNLEYRLYLTARDSNAA